MNWVKENWDKLLGAFFLVVVAGLIGFFSAVSGIKDELSEVKERLSAIDERINNTISGDKLSSLEMDLAGVQNCINDLLLPGMSRVDAHDERLQQLELRFVRIEVERSTIIQLQANSRFPK